MSKEQFVKKVKKRFRQTVVNDDHLFIPIDERKFLAQDTPMKSKWKQRKDGKEQH